MAKYALVTKIDNKKVFLYRYPTTKYNSSTLETEMYVYAFGDLCDNTLLADANNWKLFMDAAFFKTLAEFNPEIDFSELKMAFARVEKEVKVEYTDTICLPFIIMGNVDEATGKYVNFENKGLDWDNFC